MTNIRWMFVITTIITSRIAYNTGISCLWLVTRRDCPVHRVLENSKLCLLRTITYQTSPFAIVIYHKYLRMLLYPILPSIFLKKITSSTCAWHGSRRFEKWLHMRCHTVWYCLVRKPCEYETKVSFQYTTIHPCLHITIYRTQC